MTSLNTDNQNIDFSYVGNFFDPPPLDTYTWISIDTESYEEISNNYTDLSININDSPAIRVVTNDSDSDNLNFNSDPLDALFEEAFGFIVRN
jgi:hypothetical protein